MLKKDSSLREFGSIKKYSNPGNLDDKNNLFQTSTEIRITEVPESSEVPYSTLPRYTLTPRNVHNELPDVDYDGHPGLPLVLSDLLGHQGEVHRAQPFVVQGGRALAATAGRVLAAAAGRSLAAAAGHSDDQAGLVDHEAGGHLI